MRLLLATGRKAAGMVKDAVNAAAVSVPQITCEVLTQDLNIAAFSTPQSLRKALARYDGSEKVSRDLILVSGFCTADFSELERELGTPIRLGPRHAYDISGALRFVEELELLCTAPAVMFSYNQWGFKVRRRAGALAAYAG